MTEFCNLSENFIREICYLLIYDAEALSFNANFRGDYPEPNAYIHKIEIHTPAAYKRKVRLKKQNKNDYFDIDIRIPIFDLSFKNREQLYALHARRKYMIVTASNIETLALGNHRERLNIEILDNIRDDGSGKDQFIIKITGKTIIKPQLRKVTPAFRVLLFTPPFE